MQSINFKERPLSWSAINTFEYNPENWFKKYVLKEPPEENLLMIFGKKFAKSIEEGKPLVPVEIYSKVEYPLNVVFNDIPMIGFIDTYEPHTKFREYKTSNKVWSEERAKLHGQLRMYALMLYVQHKVKPEDLTIHLDCIQTKENGNFEIEFLDNVIHSFEVKLTMRDILNFGVYIMKTANDMKSYEPKTIS